MVEHFVAWWNLENLFDVTGSPLRPAWLASKLQSELQGWTASVLQKKIGKLASVIKQMNSGQGPDLMGVCEVEDKNVLKKLVAALAIPNRNYDIIHHDCEDKRGIDVAFIYDSNKYTFDENDEESFFSHEVQKRSATRDIVQANLTTSQGTELIVIGNHWPARSAGEYESAPYRMMAGETLSYWLERIQDIKGNKVAILVMGDFNDEPHSRSLTDYALSTVSRDKVVYGRNPYLYNLMWPLMGSGRASYVYDSKPIMFDQILVSKGIALKSGKFSLEDDAVKLEEYGDMVEGRYNKPVRFGRPSSGHNPNGFSDHLPISMVLKEK